MANDVLVWQSSTAFTALSAGQIHLWRASLNLDEEQKERLLGLLSIDELERVRRFYFEKDQNSFIAARGILRQILGMYLNLPPQHLRFVYSPYGKPRLEDSPEPHNLHFNLSHSGQLALYAFAYDTQLGIDIEWVREEVEYSSIARRFFAPQESEALERLPEQHRKHLFFQYWTRKEALIKAMGKGVAFPMDGLDVSGIRANQWCPLELASGNGLPSVWYVQDLLPAEQYCATIAGTQPNSQLLYWQYEPQSKIMF